MSDKYEPLRRIITTMDDKVQGQRWIATGIVNKVRKKDRRVQVTIMPENVETNWLRIYALNAGNNFISVVLPEVGSEVVLLFVGADPNSAIVLMGSLPQKGDEIPSVVGDYDWYISDKHGNKIILQNGKIIIDGDAIELGEGATRALVDERIVAHIDGHTHPFVGVPAGAPGFTQAPTTPTPPCTTSVVKAK